MVLSEMQDADSALVEQDRHDPCLAANISLLSKFSGIIEGRRVTRTPFILDSTNHLCGYVYIEKGLLRRVLVFVKKGKLFELELFQEKTDASFERLSEEQLKMVRTLMASQE